MHFFYKNQYSVPTGAIVPFLDLNSLNGYGVIWILQSTACYATFAAMLGQEVCMYALLIQMYKQ